MPSRCGIIQSRTNTSGFNCVNNCKHSRPSYALAITSISSTNLKYSSIICTTSRLSSTKQIDIFSTNFLLSMYLSIFPFILFDENHNNPRSEEHTSELQSRGHLVCRLLVETKLTQ